MDELQLCDGDDVESCRSPVGISEIVLRAFVAQHCVHRRARLIWCLASAAQKQQLRDELIQTRLLEG